MGALARLEQLSTAEPEQEAGFDPQPLAEWSEGAELALHSINTGLSPAKAALEHLLGDAVEHGDTLIGVRDAIEAAIQNAVQFAPTRPVLG